MIKNRQNSRFTRTGYFTAVIMLLFVLLAITGCSNQSSDIDSDAAKEQVNTYAPIEAPVLPESSSSETDIIKKAVILNSHEADNINTHNYEDGIIEGLRLMGYIDGQNLETTHIYLNVKSERNSLLSNTTETVKKIREIDPNVLVITEDEAIRYTRAEFFDQETPIVFTGINTSGDGSDSALIDLMADSINQPGHNITGVLEKLPISSNFNLIRQLVPEANKVLFISDDSGTSQELLEHLNLEYQSEDNEVRIDQLVTSNDFLQVQQIVLANQDNVDGIMIFLPDGLVDNNGDLVPESEVITWFVNNNKLPEVIYNESYIAGGLFSGWVVDYYQLGYHAGLMAGRILEGEDPAQISIINPETYTLYINAGRTGQIKMTIPDNIIYQSAKNSKYYSETSSN